MDAPQEDSSMTEGGKQHLWEHLFGRRAQREVPTEIVTMDLPKVQKKWPLWLLKQCYCEQINLISLSFFEQVEVSGCRALRR